MCEALCSHPYAAVSGAMTDGAMTKICARCGHVCHGFSESRRDEGHGSYDCHFVGRSWRSELATSALLGRIHVTAFVVVLRKQSSLRELFEGFKRLFYVGSARRAIKANLSLGVEVWECLTNLFECFFL